MLQVGSGSGSGYGSGSIEKSNGSGFGSQKSTDPTGSGSSFLSRTSMEPQTKKRIYKGRLAIYQEYSFNGILDIFHRSGLRASDPYPDTGAATLLTTINKKPLQKL